MKSAWMLAPALLLTVTARSPQNTTRHLTLRSRVELFRGSNQWSEVHARVAALVKKLEPVIETARNKGIIIVHAPSETMPFYANAPQRQRMLSLPAFTPPKETNITAPPLPIDDSDGGCDTPGEREHRVWT